MSWLEDMEMLWIKFLNFVSVFCSANLSCFMIVHIFKDKHKVAGDINSLNLLVQNQLSQNSFWNTIRVSNSLDPDQVGIREDLIWVQTVYKGYQQTALSRQ